MSYLPHNTKQRNGATPEAMTPEQVEAAVAKRTAQVMQEAKKSAANLVADWRNYLDEMKRDAATMLDSAEVMDNRKVAERLQIQAGAWQRADDLFFALLPGMLESLRATVAAQIEREFDSSMGKDVADQIRAADFENLKY